MTKPAVSGQSAADVIVCGGGPVGMGLAIELGQRGIATTVIERYDEPQPIPKGQNLTQRTMEHMRAWGCYDAVGATRTIPESFGIAGLTAYRSLVGDYHYEWMRRALVRPYYSEDNARLPQYAFERVLRARAARLPSVTIHYGWTVSGVRQDEQGVGVDVVDRDGGGRTLRARYAVGTDGSRSVVRESAGIAQTRADHDRLMVLLVFRSKELHALLERYPGKSYFCVLDPALDGYWKFFGRVDLGTTWFFHAPVPPGTTADNYDFVSLLHGAAGAPFDVEFVHTGFWDLRFAIADTYQAGCVFIAGDAAHSHPPYGGYGVNSGFEDARNLGWKLAAALAGWGGRQLLASYDAERRPVFQSTARDFIEKSILDDRAFLRRFDPARDRAAFEAEWAKRAGGAVSEVDAFEPHYAGSPIVDGPPDGVCSAVGSHRFEAQPGHHLAPQPATGGGTTVARLGTGFSLLALDAAARDVGAFESAAAALGTPLSVVRDTRAGGRERYGAALVLVRPDGFVAWSGESAGDAGAVLRRAIGARTA